MFSAEHGRLWNRVAARAHDAGAGTLPAEGAPATEFVPLLWARELGAGGNLDRQILARSAEIKAGRFGGRVCAIVPLYVSSICQEQCVYCNFRAGNKGNGVERLRLSDAELEREALYLIEEKGLRVIELVYSSDPKVRADSICRHVERVRSLLEERGGGMVGISAEAFDESDYKSLRDAGVTFSVLWQETYDRERYALLHPGNTKKARFEYRLDAYERMLSAGLERVGMGVLSGLADWRRDWAMLMLHEDYLRRTCGRGADILGIPRLKRAPGALMHDSPFIPSRHEFRLLVALHNVFSPATSAFVSTREDWDLCLELAQGGGSLFTLNCSTTPGGYSLLHGGSQFAANSYDAPIYAPRLEDAGLHPVFGWRFEHR